ncbi:MAG: hypothetical protein Q4C06_00045 [Bacillota bacterium]|nr:hypothetical protein [Bacillota bacterium]
MKLKINEVIENVKDEFLCYEEGEKLVVRWEKEFREWIEKNKGKKKDIVVDKGGISLKIKDEDEIFEIVDSYLDAIAEGSVKQYWTTF